MTPPVRATIQNTLAQRQWAQADLARVLGWSVQALSEIMQGKRRLDATMALELAAIVNSTPEELLAQQAAHELESIGKSDTTIARLNSIKQRAEVEKLAPVRELVKRGAISAKTPEQQLRDVKALLEITDVNDDPPYLVSTRRVQSHGPLTRSQKSWVGLVRKRAREIEPQPYGEAAFEALARSLPQEIHEPADFERLPERFAETGVRLVHVPSLPGGRIDGVSMGLDSTPMIGLSARGKRIDRVLFSLLHECAHILSGHWREGNFQIHEGGVVGNQQVEDEVNEMAEAWIFPRGLPSVGTLNANRLGELAEELGVSRALIIGQLQHRGVIPWSSVLSRGLPNVEGALSTWQ